MCVVHRRADGMHTLPDFLCDHNDLALPEHEEQKVQLQACAYAHMISIAPKRERQWKAETNRGLLALCPNILNSQTREPLEKNSINVITCTKDISSRLCAWSASVRLLLKSKRP